jgi:hypothetical protein
LADKPLNSDF